MGIWKHRQDQLGCTEFGPSTYDNRVVGLFEIGTY
jgi:hypothetical protein